MKLPEEKTFIHKKYFQKIPFVMWNVNAKLTLKTMGKNGKHVSSKTSLIF